MEVPTIGSGNVVETFTYRPAERLALPPSQPKGPPLASTESRTSALRITKYPKATAVDLPKQKLPPTAIEVTSTSGAQTCPKPRVPLPAPPRYL